MQIYVSDGEATMIVILQGRILNPVFILMQTYIIFQNHLNTLRGQRTKEKRKEFNGLLISMNMIYCDSDCYHHSTQMQCNATSVVYNLQNVLSCH